MSDWSFKSEHGVVGEWPLVNGEPVPPAFLENIFGNESELALERNMLWAFGIPTVCRYPGDGMLGKVVLGASGFGLDIYVPETMLEDAKNILSSQPDDIQEEDTHELP